MSADLSTHASVTSGVTVLIGTGILTSTATDLPSSSLLDRVGHAAGQASRAA